MVKAIIKFVSELLCCLAIPTNFFNMSQFKDHPVVTLINTIFPIILPTFTLRSVRDLEQTPETYPLVDYVIIRGGRETLDRAKNTMRSEVQLQIDILVKETKPLSWCEYDALKDAQSRQALHSYFHSKMRQFIKTIVNPHRIEPSLIKYDDVLYRKYDWQFNQIIGTEYFNQNGKHKLTGVSSVIELSFIPQEDDLCCLSEPNNVDQLQKLQGIVNLNSNSYKLIQNKIDAL